MPALITGKEVETVVREQLTVAGYCLSADRAPGETGTDIIAIRGAERIHIEAIALKSSPPARAKDFYEIFFRAASRISIGATRCVIALPARFGMGLHRRASAIGVAWQRIGIAFPELEIWLVDTTGRSYRETAWNSWLIENVSAAKSSGFYSVKTGTKRARVLSLLDGTRTIEEIADLCKTTRNNARVTIHCLFRDCGIEHKVDAQGKISAVFPKNKTINDMMVRFAPK